ncbi:hypothetical protein [Methylovirgula sp. 4M-Z18]|uniref:hypothetical protein n=1 Tax=Methylovirgula sp. 4M-Z18 TaxID=2293567 RepID=UPI000E2EB5B7|nr:hypothetical protein [Methylovirgula sp. 4M-Z18]RFB79998.1 hypothetical protein DYH55_00130 [Methylovirgula sp. 4M-Z18]
MTQFQDMPQMPATTETQSNIKPMDRSDRDRLAEIEARIEDMERKLDLLIARGAASFATGVTH